VTPPGRIVSCPACSTGYILPAELIGSGGARVRCPQCGHSFVVEANEVSETHATAAPASEAMNAARQDSPESRAAAGIEDAVPPPGEAPAAADPGESESVAEGMPGPAVQGARAPAAEEIPGPAAERLANEILDALAGRIGDAVSQAASEGRLFAEHGPEIMASFDAWRRAAGRDADPAVFRLALRERWGVDLE